MMMTSLILILIHHLLLSNLNTKKNDHSSKLFNNLTTKTSQETAAQSNKFKNHQRTKRHYDEKNEDYNLSPEVIPTTEYVSKNKEITGVSL